MEFELKIARFEVIALKGYQVSYNKMGFSGL